MRGREQQARALLLHDRRAARLSRALGLQLRLLSRLRPTVLSLLETRVGCASAVHQLQLHLLARLQPHHGAQ